MWVCLHVHLQKSAEGKKAQICKNIELGLCAEPSCAHCAQVVGLLHHGALQMMANWAMEMQAGVWSPELSELWSIRASTVYTAVLSTQSLCPNRVRRFSAGAGEQLFGSLLHTILTLKRFRCPYVAIKEGPCLNLEPRSLLHPGNTTLQAMPGSIARMFGSKG